MKKEKRSEAIIEKMDKLKVPISGAALAEVFEVSRQIIVQDIAALKKKGYPIISTNRGYILQKPQKPQRVFKVRHGHDEIFDELMMIVENGGSIVDVFVMHSAYGIIRADLNIDTKEAVCAFVKGLENREMSPLMKLTDEFHYHTVEAESESVLICIEKKLKEKNYLIA